LSRKRAAGTAESGKTYALTDRRGGVVILGGISRGEAGSAYLFDAFNRCEHARLGRWKVDGKTGAVSRK
jgi:hypothetical protein